MRGARDKRPLPHWGSKQRISLQRQLFRNKSAVQKEANLKPVWGAEGWASLGKKAQRHLGVRPWRASPT